MGELTAIRVAAEAMAVRALAIDILGPQEEIDAARWARAVEASPVAWDVFLRTERCAALVAARLERVDRLRDLPEEVRQPLAKHRRVESLRALRARAQLDEIGTAATERGWRVLVLKGGVPLARGSSLVLGLADLDMLVPAGDMPAVIAWLRTRSAGEGRYASTRHAAAQYIDGAMPVEVHHTTEADGTPTPDHVWKRAVAVAPGLLGLEPVEHAWYLCYHATAAHFNRRGRLRDVVLLSDGLGACSLDERAEIRRRTRADRFAKPLGLYFDMAEAVANEAPVVDAFQSVAFSRYAMYEIMRRAGRRRVFLEVHQLVQWVFAIQAGREERRSLWARLLVPSTGPSAYRIVGSVERLSPPIGMLWRRAVRLMHRAILCLIAWPLALWIGRAWRRFARQAEGRLDRTG
jgi:hypothetical protein